MTELIDITAFVSLGALGAGFLFQERAHLLRFAALTLEWEQRLFHAALLGGALFFVARGLALLTSTLHVTLAHDLQAVVTTVLPFSFSGSVALAVAMGYGLHLVMNLCVPMKKASAIVNRRNGDALRQLMADSMESGRPILLRMESKRVHVGFITQTPSFRKDDDFFSLLQTVAGFWKEGSSRITLDTTFTEQLEKLTHTAVSPLSSSSDAFVVVLRLGSVISAQPFETGTAALLFETPPGDAPESHANPERSPKQEAS